MEISLPHTIVNDTVPDADEVQANDAKLLEAINGIQAVGGSSTQTVTRNSVGTTTTIISDATEDVSVADTSLFLVNFQGTVNYWNDASGAWTVSLSLLINGTPQHTVFSQQVLTNHDGQLQEIRNLSGSKILSLSAGTHTIALQYAVTVTAGSFGLLGNGVRGNGGNWTGLVVPAWE